MKDVILYVFLFGLYAVLGLLFFGGDAAARAAAPTWQALGQNLVLFGCAAAVARWSVMAFKPRAHRLLDGQKIVGIEEAGPDTVLDIVQPKTLKRETQKPKLKRRRRI
ncbi:hypothetical protein [Turneriella parva]|uniref:Uncharacterized protein n=1 Tax=Turneriella parva (strain ATCC BAA-1111 / DSM 21527 / NCTC 11395 / H) TaxID=869212 RepID=I4BB05_TURPD|nr:hypothetical protein [Turneriella parva]AFM14462.1 hypothetical protein Turpa_3828 [Turneriella parva DSM 21527]